MDGLECSEYSLIDLERTKRLDAEFYKKELIVISRFLSSHNPNPITDYVNISDGNHLGISEHFTSMGIPYYRGQDVHAFFIENSNPICIDTRTYNAPFMQRSHLKKDDILLSIVGTIGEVSLVSTNQESTCNCKLAILRPFDTINSAILALFLKSKYGRAQIEKFKRGAVQMGLLLEDMDQIYIPLFSKEFKTYITEQVAIIKNKNKVSSSIFDEANNKLLMYLGMHGLDNQNSNSISIKTVSSSLDSSGRLDAEYYQPKYDQLFETISKYPTKTLGGDDGLVYFKKSIEPGSEAYQEEGIPFVRVSDVDKFEVTKPSIKIPNNIVPNIEDLFPKKDTILFSKDGSVGIAYKVQKDEQFVTSGALLHLIIKDTSQVLPDYLTLVLNSPIVQLQAERDSSGAIIQHWKPSEIAKVVIPILDMPIQQEIAQKVQKSFALRAKAKSLLDNAIKAVEMAIETDEATALHWLEMQN